MGTTLEGKQINQTYQGLLKTTDNNEVGSSAKEITDGKGNGTGVTLDNSGNLVANATVTANAFVGDGSQLTNVPYPVTSVNTQTGDVVLDTDDIAEGSNEYYTDAKVEANSAVAANTAKVGITAQQTSDILTNNDKVGITTQQANEIAANTLKVGITTDQANEIAANTLKTGITQSQADAISANTLKNSYPTDDANKLLGIEAGAEVNTVDSVNSLTGAVSLGLLDLDDVGSDGNSGEVLTTNGQGSFTFAPAGGGTGTVTSVNTKTGAVVLDTDDIDEGDNNLYYTEARVSANTDVVANTAKVGITTQQAADITTNNAKNSYPTTDATKVGFISVTQAVDLDTIESNVATNNAKVGITTQQANDITANNAKVGITTQQANDITANNAKNSYPSTDSTKVGFISITQAVDLDTIESDVATNNAKTGITAQQASDITTNNAKISFDSTSSTKLGTIEENADVTDTANVTAAGALMDSEVDADIKTLSLPANTTISDFAKTILDNADASTVRTTIGAGTSSLVLGTSAGTALEGDTVIPINNNQLTNGAGYINEAAQTIHTNAIGNAIDFSARVTLDGGVAEGTSGIIKNLQNIL